MTNSEYSYLNHFPIVFLTIKSRQKAIKNTSEYFIYYLHFNHSINCVVVFKLTCFRHMQEEDGVGCELLTFDCVIICSSDEHMFHGSYAVFGSIYQNNKSRAQHISLS